MENDNGIQSAPQTDVTPESSSEGLERQTASPAQNGVQSAQPAPENVPFDKHPRWQELQRERKRERAEAQQLRQELAEMRGRMSATQGQPQAPIDPQEKAQIEFLLEKLTPHLKDRLGLSKLEQLEKQYNELSNSWQSSQAENELNSVVGEFKDLGIDPLEIRQSIEDAISESNLNYSPGIIKMVARNLMWDKQRELAERAVNLQQIKQKEVLKRGQVQGASASGNKSGKQTPEQILREAGGEIDFTR